MPRFSLIVLLLAVYVQAEAAVAAPNSPARVFSRCLFGRRGGALSDRDATAEIDSAKINEHRNNNATVEAYVAAMREKDSQNVLRNVPNDEDDEDIEEPKDGSGNNAEDKESTASSESSSTADDDPAVVGVKSHHNSKKSNAVGDPDGDDDDDSDDSLSDFSDEWEEIDEFEEFVDDLMVEPQLQVEVELVEENSGNDDAEDDDTSDKPSGGGGVGVRLGRMKRGKSRNSWRSSAASSKLSQDQERLLEAWTPHIYFPPTPSALAYLTDHALLLDASSKNRLDRRTLYAGLLIEWGSVETKLSTASRKFLPTASSQALQAALSMATQPQWRQSAPRTSGIRFYEDDESASKAATLSMQETIAMALVRIFIRGSYKVLIWSQSLTCFAFFAVSGSFHGMWTTHS